MKPVIGEVAGRTVLDSRPHRAKPVRAAAEASAIRTNTVAAARRRPSRRSARRQQRPARSGLSSRKRAGAGWTVCVSRSMKATATNPGRASMISLLPSPEDPHYVLNRTTGEIRFGDGMNGHIPVANPNNPDANCRRARVPLRRRQAGQRPGQARSRRSDPDRWHRRQCGRQSAWRRTAGGTRRHWTKRKQRAPHAIKSRCRAVTAEDYE